MEKNNYLASYNPATEEKVWEGVQASQADVEKAVQSCHQAFPSWSSLSFEERVKYLKQFQLALKDDLELLSLAISQETGKPLWDSKLETQSMINKVDISINAYLDRCKSQILDLPSGKCLTRHKPHGVVAVFGPYNFPGHLPNGHLVPALLAGNTCVFKPSELTPHTAEVTMKIWERSGIPKGVIELVLGGKETGKFLAGAKINGLFFTGSFQTGEILSQQFAKEPDKILALEMGGNNPLIVHEVADLDTACCLTIQSAFLSSGQRCTCARRLILVEGKEADAFLEKRISRLQKIKVGAFTEIPEPFMGPVISANVADMLLKAQDELAAKGGIKLVEMKRLERKGYFLTPGLMDVTAISTRKDEEFFGPFLQVIYVKDFESALQEANNTAYGLSSGILSDTRKYYDEFYNRVKAGVINWNQPLTGASSFAPFGGIGHSGNHRPSAYYAADYCAYPVASMVSDKISMPKVMPPGLRDNDVN